MSRKHVAVAPGFPTVVEVDSAFGSWQAKSQFPHQVAFQVVALL